MVLHDLLRIKKIREDSAERELKKAIRYQKECEEEVERRKQALQEYIEWRCQEEQRLYDNIINMHVQQHDLDFLKQKVAVMREKDASLEEAISEAEKTLSDAESEVVQAQEVHRLAQLAVEKFTEFCRAHDEEAKKEALRLEDLEMEEFTAKSKN